MIRKIIILLAVGVLCLNNVFAQTDNTTGNETERFRDSTRRELPGSGNIFPWGIFRGTFTILQTPIEPIRFSYVMIAPSMKEAPIVNTCILPITLPAGLLLGTLFGTLRVFLGTIDIISLGSIDAYNEMLPPFIWDSKWNDLNEEEEKPLMKQ